MSAVTSHTAIDLTRRHTRRWRVGGLLVAIIVAVALLSLGDRALGLAPAIAPAVAGLIVVAAVCIGELTVRHTYTSTRTASPRARRLGDQLPRGPLALAITTLTVLATALALGALMGDPDDLGRAGRSLTVACGSMSESRGPWPGSFYALPIAMITLASVALAVVTCRAIVNRPAPDTESEALDTALRRWSGRTVLLALTLAASATLAPVLALMASASARMDCAPGWYGPLAVVTGVGAALSALLVPALLAALLLPPRASAPTAGGDRP